MKSLEKLRLPLLDVHRGLLEAARADYERSHGEVSPGEFLQALINDGYLQHMRVGADSGIGAKYIAREDAEVVGMIGSGGMARSHVESFLLARRIKKIQVYSPTKENREAYAKEIRG